MKVVFGDESMSLFVRLLLNLWFGVNGNFSRLFKDCRIILFVFM